MAYKKRGWICLDGGYFCNLIFILVAWANFVYETTAQMTEVFHGQETAFTNLNQNITIYQSFLVSSGATNHGKLTDSSHLSKIEMRVTVMSPFSWKIRTFPLVSLIQSAEITDKEKDMPQLHVKISAMLLKNVSNVNSMNITIMSEVHPGLNVVKTSGFPRNLNNHLAWLYSGMKNFSVGYNATPSETTKFIYRTTFNITDYQQRLLNEFYQPLNTFFCLNQNKIIKQDIEPGYNVVMCVVGFIFAFLIWALFAVVKIIFTNNTVSFVNDNLQYADYGDILILSPRIQKSSYQYTFQKHHKKETSIVNVLTMDRERIDREFINQDLSYSERLENDMEKAWCNGSSEITILSVQQMQNSKNITPELARKAISSYKSEIAKMEKELELSHQAKFFELQKKISIRNQNKIAELKAEAEKIINEAKRNNYRPEIVSMLEKEEEIKMQNALAELQLLQQEEVIGLKKDNDSQRRINYKNIQKDMLNMIRENSDMDQEREEWFMRERQKQQEEWLSQIEKNILQQQLALEENMGKRQAMAEQADAQDLDHGELLDTIAKQQISIVKKFKNVKVIPQDEAKLFTDEIFNKLKSVKENYDERKSKEGKELNQKLSGEKTASLDDIRAKHKLELEELEKKYRKNAQEGKAEPLDHMKDKQKLESQQHLELLQAEGEIDVKHASQLQEQRDKLMKETKIKLEILQNELIEKLKERGASGEQIDDMLRAHREAVNAFEQDQLTNQKNQNDLILKKLSRDKVARMKKAEEEENSKKEIKEFKENVIKELLDSQISMSEKDRETILKEHEKQMIKLDKSLTLNKIRQQQILESKVAKKREEKMKRLMEKQESERLERQSSEAAAEVDDSKFIEKQIKERLAVIQESTNRSTDMEEVENTLNRERAEDIKKEDDKLGALVAKMKLEKAKELCEIDEKAQAINELKTNLINELHSNGALDDSQCSNMIDEHNEQRKAYLQQQQEEKNKQQELLRENLQKNMLKRQETMVQRHEAEIKNVLENSRDNVTSKMKRLVLKNKHMMEMEKLRNKMTHEMSQIMEEISQKNELEIKKQLQEEELLWITNLIKLGKLKRTEMEKVMQMLLPGKSQEEIAQVLKRMIKEDTDDSGNIKASSSSSFELRIREIYLENKKELKQKSNQERKNFKKKKARVTDIDEADSGTSKSTVGKLIPMSNQPIRSDLKDVSDDGNDMDNEFRNVHSSSGQNVFSESVGPSTSAFLINDPDIQMKRNGMKLPPVRLSPLENTIDTPKRQKKKKKKKLKDTFEDSEV